MIFHRFILGDMVTNCYIVANEDTKNAILFDAPADADKILQYAENNGLKIVKVMLTHAHFDHILALEEIKNRTNCDIYVHEDESQYLKDNKLNLSKAEDNLKFPEGDVFLRDEDEIDLDGIKIKVIHTPGHTVGSVSYLVEDLLISGDTLFAGSIGRCDFPLGSLEDELSSIKNKLMLLDDNIKVYPGHGFSTTIGKQRKDNPYLI